MSNPTDRERAATMLCKWHRDEYADGTERPQVVEPVKKVKVKS